MMKSFLNTTTHNIAWLHKRYLANELELKPPFQRNPVWTPKQKSYLIDTILNGYPIPELYMQEYSDSRGNDVYVVVDGQQRVRACMEFIAGEFSIDASDSPAWADLTFDDLSEEQKKAIYNYNFVVRLLPEMPDVDLRSMFQRLNRNVVALNRQELRHATYWGAFISTMEKLADDDRWSLLNIFTANGVRRMQDIEFVSELAVAFLYGIGNKKDNLEEAYAVLETDFDRQSETESMFNGVLSELVGIQPTIRGTRWKKKSDFYSLFLVLAELRDDLPLARDTRTSLADTLVTFGKKVDAYLRNEDTSSEMIVQQYAMAVERAASDVARRRARHEVLRQILVPVVAP